jgi:hypothetical protein
MYYSANCDGFDVNAAISMMRVTFKCGGEDLNPKDKEGSSGRCACAVRHFLQAGFHNNDRAKAYLNNIGRFPDGAAWEPHLKSLDFRCDGRVIAKGKSKKEIDDIYRSYPCIAGDISIIPSVPSKGSSHVGHIAMFDGSSWVSDYTQPFLYPYGEPSEVEVRIYRYKGCKPTEFSSQGLPPQKYEAMNQEEMQRGKKIMLALKQKFSLQDYQVIGIGSSLYCESHKWNPKGKNSTSSARGIAQWLSARQEGICKYLNGIYHNAYEPVSKRGEGNFIEIPLERQIEGMIWELETSENRVIPLIRNTKTALDACNEWTDKYERCGDADKPAHRAWINSAEKAFRS